MIEYHDVQPSTHTYVTITSTTPMLPLAYLKQNMIFNHAIFAYIQIDHTLYPLLQIIHLLIRFNIKHYLLTTSFFPHLFCVVEASGISTISFQCKVPILTWNCKQTNFEDLQINFNKNTKYSLYLTVKLPTYSFVFIWYKSTTKMYISVAC